MKKNAISLCIVTLVLVSMACSCSANSDTPSNCSQAEMDSFWADLNDNGQIDSPHECGAESHPTPVQGGFGIDAPQPKQPPCSMNWNQPQNGDVLPENGAYNFDWSPQAGAVDYEVVIIGSDGEEIPLNSKGSDKTYFMENLGEGTYTVVVRAKDFQGNTICEAKTSFSKENSQVKKDDGKGADSVAKQTPPSSDPPKQSPIPNIP